MTPVRNAEPLLLQLCGTADWAAARRAGRVVADAAAPFIHLSAPHQVHLPANRLFAGRTDLVLLHIDPALLDDPVRWEPGVPGAPQAMLFPHLYGTLPVAAVTAVTEYRPGPEGCFPALSGDPAADHGVGLDLDE